MYHLLFQPNTFPKPSGSNYVSRDFRSRWKYRVASSVFWNSSNETFISKPLPVGNIGFRLPRPNDVCPARLDQQRAADVARTLPNQTRQHSRSMRTVPVHILHLSLHLHLAHRLIQRGKVSLLT